MKKLVLVFALLCSNFAFADYYRTTVSDCDDAQMRTTLDNEAAQRGTVITVVECEDTEEETTVVSQRYNRTWDNSYAYRPCENQLKPKSAVVRREYFVRETVQQYRPVVRYVPSGTYVRVRPVCTDCGF